jgi:hypothetical protein
MILTILLLISGLAVSIIGAYYSILGLATLFAGAYWAVITMGITLEVAKLVTVSWLYRNWKLDLLPQSIRMYLLSAVLMLMFITSIGIFGFLSKAHLDTSAPNTGNRLLVKNIERQIESEKKAITGAQKIVDQLDKALDKVIDKDADKGLIERQKQQNERNRANNIITSSSNKITQLSNQKLNYDKNQLAIDKEIGPFKYVAEILFGDADDGNLDRAVRFVIICLIFVFDPLAVLMLVAVNVSLKERELNNKSYRITYPKESFSENKDTELKKDFNIQNIILQQIKERLSDKNKSTKERKRDYEKFVQELGAKELNGLSPDEIKIKLNQIMDWNEKKGKDDKNT